MERKGMNKTGKQILSLFTFFLSGLIVFVVFSHIRPMPAEEIDLLSRICIILIFWLFSRWAHRSESFKDYEPLFYAFFTASAAMAADYYLPTSKFLLDILHISVMTPAGLALDKLDSSIIIIGSILILTGLSGAKPADLFLQKGNLKKGLLIGIIAFLICVSGSVFVAGSFGAKDLSPANILPWIPWILIFIFGNAMNEELLFRGLFLHRYEPVLGKFLSNLIITIPFVLHHTGVTYTNEVLIFLIYLIPLSLAWGYIAQKTNSLWGSVLFHAGTDIPVVLAIFSKLS